MMIDVVELIPSKDMKKALRESDRIFSDMEKATLIANLNLTPRRKRELLQELVTETADELLRSQLRYHLDHDQRLMDWFRDVTNGYVFGVQVDAGEDSATDAEYPPQTSIEAYFTNFEAAYEFGCYQQECSQHTPPAPFWICKWRAHEALPDDHRVCNAGSRGWMKFEANGELSASQLWETGTDEDLKAPWTWVMAGSEDTDERWPRFLYFENRWIDLPNLYEQSEVVCVLDARVADAHLYNWAIICDDRSRRTASNEAASERLRAIEGGVHSQGKIPPSYADLGILVAFLNQNGTFTYESINPVFLERTEIKTEGDEALLQRMALEAVQNKRGLLKWIWWVLKERFNALA